MPCIGSTRFRFVPVLPLALVLAALGCREDATWPTGPKEPAARALATTAAQALSFRQVSAGEDHTCGVTPDYRAYCWGRNEFGTLGDGTISPGQLAPVPVAGTLQFRQVSAGVFSSCGVSPENRAFCWGHNGTGRLGDGTTTQRLTPVPVVGGLRFLEVTVGSGHTCGVTLDYRAYCWGDNDLGALGDGTTTERHQPVRVAGGLAFRQLTAGGTLGSLHTCGVTTANVAYCWGRNDLGQLGDGTTTQRLKPVRVAGGHRFLQVRAAEVHTCGVTLAHRVFCWGENRSGQLGDGSTTQHLKPVRVAGAREFIQVTAGGGNRGGGVGFAFSCGLTPQHQAFCWGSNDLGQLGDGTGTRRLRPVAVAGGLVLRQVSAGTGHTCGVTPADRAFCWGSNRFGQLGDGTTTGRFTPVPVAAPAP
jgi:alpha-tubulin suppressor-like RCC1 family protein